MFNSPYTFSYKEESSGIFKMILPEREEVIGGWRKLDYEEVHNLWATSDTADASNQRKWDGWSCKSWKLSINQIYILITSLMIA